MRAGLFEEDEFYSLVDQNGDGLISFGEYMFFITVLAIPESDFDIAFRALDENGDGVLALSEFQKVSSAA